MSNFSELLGDYLSTGYHSVRGSSAEIAAVETTVCLSETPNPDEQALLEKMLSSINLYPDNNCIIKIDTNIPKQKMVLKINNNFEITTHHPQVLLQDASKKRSAWEDLKLLKSKLDEVK